MVNDLTLWTQIAIKKETRKKLKKLKIVKRESYDEVITRMIKNKKMIERNKKNKQEDLDELDMTPKQVNKYVNDGEPII